MKFPKPVMKTGELVAMGFTREYLRRAYGTRGQRFATKINPAHSNSAILFDTAGFSAWMEKDIAAQDKGMRRR
jgi:hypothetical protein